MKTSMNVCVALGLAWLALGCDEPLKSVELVAEPRVLGARVEVAGAPEQAAPRPGETATVSFLVATPELSPPVGFGLAVCSAVPRDGSRPACQAEPFAVVESPNGEADVPSLTFDVPSDLDPAGRLVVLGIICPAGSPSADGTSCDGEDPGTPVQLELELGRDDDLNLNPELEPQSLGFDDAEWPELEAVEGDCAGLGFPEVAASSQHTLGVVLDEADRDSLPRPTSLDPARESLQLSHFVTGGDLQRAFQSIAWNSDELERRVTWKAPKTPGLVRFWFVLRDFRGGGAFTERAVCVQ